MSQENVEIVRGIIEAFSDRDAGLTISFLAPEIESHQRLPRALGRWPSPRSPESRAPIGPTLVDFVSLCENNSTMNGRAPPELPSCEARHQLIAPAPARARATPALLGARRGLAARIRFL